jgi:tetratricopeptide (TPR) repeat protein
MGDRGLLGLFRNATGRLFGPARATAPPPATADPPPEPEADHPSFGDAAGAAAAEELRSDRSPSDSGAGAEAIDAAASGEAPDTETRAHASPDWAPIQHEGGSAADVVPERADWTRELDEAFAAHRATLEKSGSEQASRQSAATQYELGRTLYTLGLRETGTDRLNEAIVAFRAALDAGAACEPLERASIQNGLGDALRAIGGRESGTARLEEAIEAYDEAYRVFAKERAFEDQMLIAKNLVLARGDLERRQAELQRPADADDDATV